MLKNYFLIAWRQLLKNKLYASINILGLVVGLSVYLFGSLLVDYERSHDLFYENADRIFTAGSVFGPTANIGVGETNGIHTAFAPFIDAEIDGIERIARIVGTEFLVSVDDTQYYQYIRFVDPEFTEIFQFDYVSGSAEVLKDPSSVILTATAANKYFGETSPIGKVLTLDHKVSLTVGAVIHDLPINTHFESSILSEHGMELIAPLQALNRANDYDLAGNFNNLSTGDNTYMLVSPGKDRAWLQASMDGVYERHFPEEGREFITSLKVRPLVEQNTLLWDAIGLPVLDSVRLLAFLVLVIAIVNYTNLATAQSLGRSREIGLRKTMGASRAQLVAQFLVESFCVAAIAMLVSIALLELIIPWFNTAAGRGLALDYLEILPWLLGITAAVGLVAGAYPAYLITRTQPIEALRQSGSKGAAGGRFRSFMLVLQFSISIFMLALVLVVYLQNVKVEEDSNIYPKSQIITLERLDVEGIRERRETLRNEFMALSGVEHVSFSSHLPYQQSASSFDAGPVSGDRDQAFLVGEINIDHAFLDTYNIPLVAGRKPELGITADTLTEDSTAGNVWINESTVYRMGFESPQDAIGRNFYDFPETRPERVYTIAGVVQDQNFQGFHNQVKPLMFAVSDYDLSHASIRVDMSRPLAVMSREVENVWQNLISEYPIQNGYLQDEFDDTFLIYQGMSAVLGGFAFLALSLSMIGLFGLAAFLAVSRTKEIGVRKIMGANVAQVTRLLIWQFSKPVFWAMALAIPAAYLASGQFLNFFAERIQFTELIVIAAGCLAMLFAWLIVGVHAVRIARANPIHALRHE